MPLNQVTGSCTRAAADQGTFPATNQRTADSPDSASNQCTLSSTVVHPSIAPSLSGYAIYSESSK
jgi:hypothetical protein